MRSLRIFGIYLRLGLSNFLAYRASAALATIFGVIFLLAEFLTVEVYYSFDQTIGNWDKGSFFVLLGTLNVMTYLYTFLFEVAHDEFAFKIRYGLLDHDLLRPIDSQLLASLHRVDYAALLGLPPAIWLIIYGLKLKGAVLGAPQVSLYLLLLANGTCLVYLINQLSIGFAFWFGSSSNLVPFANQLVQMGIKTH